jgi:hypothetical protein
MRDLQKKGKSFSTGLIKQDLLRWGNGFRAARRRGFSSDPGRFPGANLPRGFGAEKPLFFKGFLCGKMPNGVDLSGRIW